MSRLAVRVGQLGVAILAFALAGPPSAGAKTRPQATALVVVPTSGDGPPPPPAFGQAPCPTPP